MKHHYFFITFLISGFFLTHAIIEFHEEAKVPKGVDPSQGHHVLKEGTIKKRKEQKAITVRMLGVLDSTAPTLLLIGPKNGALYHYSLKQFSVHEGGVDAPCPQSYMALHDATQLGVLYCIGDGKWGLNYRLQTKYDIHMYRTSREPKTKKGSKKT